MKKKMKKWLSCMMAAAMVMSTVNLPTNILASDFGDGVEISVEDENEDAPEVVVDGEEDAIEDSAVIDEVPDDISSENDDEQLFSDHVDEDIDAVVDDGDSAYAVGTSEAEAIVNVAKGEVGVSGRPNKYTRWYGKINDSYSYEWCHAFVSWCADQAGVADKVPKTAACRTGVTWFKNKGQWKARSSGYIPSAGDIIYFDFNSDGTSDHVGIVTGSSNGRVYTIEGNAKDTVKVNGGYSNGYTTNSSNILGYGVPAYSSTNPEPTNGIRSYGFDAPSNGEKITGSTFLFQGWVDASKEINNITCSVNGGSKYITTNLYKREDVPNATAFRAEISSDVLNMGDNRVAVCVNFQDNTGVVVEERTVNRGLEGIESYGFDAPSNGDEITGDTFLFQGWVDASKEINSITCSVNGGSKYITTNLYKREDVPNATAFRVEISSDVLNWGNNRVALCVNFQDNTGVVLEERTIVKQKPKVLLGYDSPVENDQIGEEQFQFSGWIETTRKMDSLVCMINGGEQEITALFYKREDVPNAVAFRADISASYLNYGDNEVAVCVNWSDGEKEVLETRKVIKCTYDYIESPQENQVITCKDTKFLLQGWSVNDKKEIDHFEYTLNNQRYETVAHTRSDLASNARYYRVEIGNDLLASGNNAINVSVYYSDGTSRNIGKVNVVGSLEHTWDNGEISRKATCTTEGEKTYTCTTCQKTRTESIAKTGHTEVKDVAMAATCESEGKTEGSHCSICGTVIKKQELIPATGHTWDNGKVTKEATCTEEGEKTYTCTTCQKTRTESIAKTGHTEVKDVAIAETCESEGKTEGSHCSVCNSIIKKQETIPATGHTWDNGKVTKEATCTEAGEKTYTCTTCQKTRTESTAKTGHTEVKDAAVVATCESEGKTEGSHCSVCGTVIKAQEPIPATGHTWDNGKVTKEATCTEAGEKTYTCTTCQKTRTESIAKTGHTEVKDAAVAATCESEGKTEGSHCSVCNTVIKKQEIIPAVGHTWDNGKITKEATCTETGEKIYTCATCQKTKTEAIASTGHSKITKFVKNATCETEGYTGDIYCKNCGELLEEGKVTEKLPHTWKETQTVQEATCTEAGEKIYTCTTCNRTKTEQIPATGHKWSSWKKVSDATALQKEKQQRTCSECGASQNREYGNKLKSVMKVNYSSILLKTKQSTSILTVSGMAKGDYVSKVQSGNNGIVKVTKYTKDGKIQLTAQGKTGSTKVTIRLAGGAVKQISVKVQKGTVKTTSVKVSPSKVTLKKGAKKTISVTISPATSQEKVTYTSSNKNIAAVSTKGVITAKKQGTAKITVKSGSKKQIITVTVK